MIVRAEMGEQWGCRKARHAVPFWHIRRPVVAHAGESTPTHRSVFEPFGSVAGADDDDGAVAV